LALGFGLIYVTALWQVAVLQMRRAGDQTHIQFPGALVGQTVVRVLGFVAGVVLLAGTLLNL
jgi:hypothetical protein